MRDKVPKSKLRILLNSGANALEQQADMWLLQKPKFVIANFTYPHNVVRNCTVQIKR